MTSRKTMSDLARLAGVNVSTVSRALNDSPLVKPDTKAEILKIAQEIGYSVNVAARNLRRQSSETIALVTPLRPESGERISDPFFLEMVGSVSMAASKRGYDLLVSTPKEESAIAERRLLQTGRADGLIIIGQAGREDRLRSIGPVENRIVVWGGRTGKTSYTIVGSDNVRGGYLATSHLLKSGRKRVLFIGDRSLPEVELRYQGYVNAHREIGQPVTKQLILTVGFGYDVRMTIPRLEEHIRTGSSFDAIFAASDALAIAAIEALRKNRFSVPKDVAVVGYDDVAQAALFHPALTTVSQNIEEGAERLVDSLIRKLEGEEVESSLTDTRLIIRESCGANSTD